MDVTEPKISIITPTFKRDEAIVRRCIESVNTQLFENWEHIIVSDCPSEEHIVKLCEEMPNSEKRKYLFNPDGPSDTWGSYPRQLGLNEARGEFCCFLDDDNVILSNYLRDMHAAAQGRKASICKILHNGPVNEHADEAFRFVNVYANVWVEVTGTPPKKYYIDTLNLMVRTESIRQTGWVCHQGPQGYCNDGDTYQLLFEEEVKEDYEVVDEILAIHF